MQTCPRVFGQKLPSCTWLSVTSCRQQSSRYHFSLLNRISCILILRCCCIARAAWWWSSTPRIIHASRTPLTAPGALVVSSWGATPARLWSRSGCRAQARLDTSKKLRFLMTSCLLSIQPACLTGPASLTPRSRRSASPKSVSRPGQARAYKRPKIPHAE